MIQKPPVCPVCGATMIWLICPCCQGSGADYPLGGNHRDCECCAGEGGAYECPDLFTSPRHIYKRQRRAHLRALLVGHQED